MVYKVYKDGRMNVNGQLFRIEKYKGETYRTFLSTKKPRQIGLTQGEALFRRVDIRKIDFIYIFFPDLLTHSVLGLRLRGSLYSNDMEFGVGKGQEVYMYTHLFKFDLSSGNSSIGRKQDNAHKWSEENSENYHGILVKISLIDNNMHVYLCKKDFTLQGKTIEQIENEIPQMESFYKKRYEVGTDWYIFNTLETEYEQCDVLLVQKIDSLTEYISYPYGP